MTRENQWKKESFENIFALDKPLSLQLYRRKIQIKRRKKRKKFKKKNEAYKKMKTSLGFDSSESKAFGLNKKEEEQGRSLINADVVEEVVGEQEECKTPTGIDFIPTTKKKTINEEARVTISTATRPMRRSFHKPEQKEDPKEIEEKKKAAREASEKIKNRQQKYIQKMAAKKAAEQIKKKEQEEKKEKIVKKLVEEARTKMIMVPKPDPKPDSKQAQAAAVTKYVPPEEFEKMHGEFLARNLTRKKESLANVTDFSVWKKKQNIPDNTKVFVILDGYGSIRKALKNRGWVENRSKDSTCFDFKWTLRVKDIDFQSLSDFQIVNHYEKNGFLTTKAGLCHNLRNLIWFNNVDIDTFYPRCFDLLDSNELEDFKEEFKSMKAEGILKEFIIGGGKVETVGEERLLVALNICQKRLRDIDDILDESNVEMALVTAEEWEVIGSDEISPENLAKKKHLSLIHI
eukprot:TRINITY_DN4871_c0_g1_i1.p1 TRINITY_DN4871_c0_g1~~TRINITY_DN4871_c0_g1_i1.p1  ORF type:complete len:460 (-),score=117.39 TRINITY_DN4871_c0_g1_i1:174-1553(-)